MLKKLPPTYLNGVNFATFGLGDSSYPKYACVLNLGFVSMLTLGRFNWAVRKLYKRLLQLGANDIYPTGEADQQHPEG